MATEGLLQRVTQAETKLLRDVETAEQERLALIDAYRGTVRSRARETLEETPEMQLARETIERLQLRLELLRNIKMNWRGFQSGLTRMGMTMRINQSAHLEHLIAFLELGHGVALAGDDEVDIPKPNPDRALMTHEIQPTGAGKTGAFAIDIALMDVPSLILVPFDSLLDQTKQDMIKIGNISEDQIGIVGGGSKEIGCKHTIATYAGHAAQIRKGGEYARFMKTQCKLVICDEVHHQALGDRMQESIKEIDTLSNGEPTEEEVEMLKAEREVVTHLTEQTGVKSLKIGFTATPRGSKKHVRKYFPHCLGRVYHREMVEAGLVVPFKIVQCDGSVFAGEMDDYLNQDKEAEILHREGIYGKLVGEYADVLSAYRSKKHKSNEMPMYGMAFCTNHKECEVFVEEAMGHGLRCRIVTGKEAKGRAGQTVINAAVDALIKEEIDLIVTVEKLATGFNRPEVNAIISARITSAAKTIQYIGRGGRCFTDDDGQVKEDCHVFEINWTLKRNAKRGKKPLRLADALAYNGEEPEAICSMADGSTLEYENKYYPDEDGTVDVGGRMGVVLSWYADHLGISRTTLNRYERSKNPAVIGHVRIGVQKVPVYDKEVVDAWDCITQAALITAQGEVGEEGTATVKGILSIGCSKYADLNHLTYETLLTAIQIAEIEPIGYVKSGGKPVPVYPKDQVDQLPCLKASQEAGELQVDDEDGTVLIGDLEAVHINLYASSLGIKGQTLKKAVKSGKLFPVGKARNKNSVVSVYRKAEVDALQCVKEATSLAEEEIADDGTVTHLDTLCIGVNKYEAGSGVKYSKIQADIDEARVPVFGYARSGTKTVPIYEKTKVDVLPCFNEAKIDHKGLVTIKGVLCIAVKKYAEQNLDIHHQTLQRMIESAKLKPFGMAKSGRADTPVYRKDQVDLL